MRGDVLTTEQVSGSSRAVTLPELIEVQVYIHGKVCIVDDRLAIIGSANINERSQRGDRDSEIAAVIRDTDMVDGCGCYIIHSPIGAYCRHLQHDGWSAVQSRPLRSYVASTVDEGTPWGRC